MMNNMDVIWLSITGLLLALSVFLICRLLSFKRGIGKLTGILADIRKSGFLRRAHLGFFDEPLKDLGTELNAIMDAYQDIIEENRRLELSHKQLIANISHDIRTPLTSLMGYAEVLKDQSCSPEERQEYLEIIYAKAVSINRMIDEFFDLAKLEAEDTSMELAQVNLAEIVQESLTSFYQDFIRVSVTPVVRLPDESIFVWGNRAAIDRVLNNLISNALKYGLDGGALEVSVREEENRVWVDVLDRGRGIPACELPRVFDRLYTAEASRNAAMRGAGLGLAIARQLVEKQGGEITAQSVPGEQTVFSFCLNRVCETIGKS